MPIKSFRGKIADNGIDTIVLHTNTGSTGYRITKFQLFAAAPGTSDVEHIVKIYKIPQRTVDAIVDFSDNTLMGVAWSSGDSATPNNFLETVIFDNEVVNQDIYITHSELVGTTGSNYYLELEQVKLDLNENTVATLKDIRNIQSPDY